MADSTEGTLSQTVYSMLISQEKKRAWDELKMKRKRKSLFTAVQNPEAAESMQLLSWKRKVFPNIM